MSVSDNEHSERLRRFKSKRVNEGQKEARSGENELRMSQKEKALDTIDFPIKDQKEKQDGKCFSDVAYGMSWSENFQCY